MSFSWIISLRPYYLNFIFYLIYLRNNFTKAILFGYDFFSFFSAKYTKDMIYQTGWGFSVFIFIFVLFRNGSMLLCGGDFIILFIVLHRKTKSYLYISMKKLIWWISYNSHSIFSLIFVDDQKVFWRRFCEGLSFDYSIYF